MGVGWTIQPHLCPKLTSGGVWFLKCQDAALERVPADIWNCLSADERVRAHQLMPGKPQVSFVAARWLLRNVLADHLGCPPDRVAIRIAASGKPYLADEASPLHFSISHSWPFAVVAVSFCNEVGVDVEIASRSVDLQLLAPRVLTDVEHRIIIAAKRPHDVFLSLWTVKEAIAKAISEGLRFDFRDIAVEFPSHAHLAGSVTAEVSGFGMWKAMLSSIEDNAILAIAGRPSLFREAPEIAGRRRVFASVA